jgi:hypothetical protein
MIWDASVRFASLYFISVGRDEERRGISPGDNLSRARSNSEKAEEREDHGYAVLESVL